MEQFASKRCWRDIASSVSVVTNTVSTKPCLNHIVLFTGQRVPLKEINFE
jgi:hypothetical protein